MNEWQPIDTAPKDGTRILLAVPKYDGGWRLVCGEWYADEFAKKPRPYWTNDQACLWGIVTTRQAQPRFWQALEPPKWPAPSCKPSQDKINA